MGPEPAKLQDIAAFAGRPIFQLAFVVDDLDRALGRFSSLFGPSAWRCWTFGSADHTSCEYQGEAADFATRLALNDQQPQLELIQPLSGSGPHGDWLRDHGEGPHHVGVVVDSVQDAIARAAGRGYEALARGSGIGAANDGAWAYIDTSVALGLMVEVVEPPTSMPPPAVWRPEAVGSGPLG
jgi:hypothetical protein